MKPVLLVEDDEDDVFLVKTACERSECPHVLHVARNGTEALAYLAGEGPYADRAKHPLPSLVFLDIKMPGMNGHEVLQWIRSRSEFAQLPVVMLTTSYLASDVERAYALRVNSFLRKRDDMVEFREGMQMALNYWLGYNVGPE